MSSTTTLPPPTGNPSSTSSSSTMPKRTTKETHPNLPPGLILDADGKVCKVCNSWQDWAKIKLVKKGDQATASGGGSGKGKGTGKAAGMGGFAALMGGTGAASGSSSSPASSPIPTTTATATSTDRTDRTDCPPDTASLGRSTWTFLHTTAAYYPLSATPAQQTHMRNLLSSISVLYPCSWCASDFAQDIERNPPDAPLPRPGQSLSDAIKDKEAKGGMGMTNAESTPVNGMTALSGRAALSKWLCERHNEVNRKLGKSEFSCALDKLGERWKEGPKDGRCD